MSLMGQSRRKSNVCCDGSFSQVRKSGEGAGCGQPCRHVALRQVSRRGFRLVTESKQEAMPARRQSDGSRSPACHSDTPAEPSAVPQRQTRRDRTRVNRKSSGTSPNIFRIIACEPISGLPLARERHRARFRLPGGLAPPDRFRRRGLRASEGRSTPWSGFGSVRTWRADTLFLLPARLTLSGCSTRRSVASIQAATLPRFTPP
jgi:hypothetical protein